MRFAFILAEEAVWPVQVMCDVLRVSRSGYYPWKGRPVSARAIADSELVAEIKAAHKAGRGNYGSPRVHRALRQNGRRVGKKRVARLMHQEGIVAKRRRKFVTTTDSKHALTRPDCYQAKVVASSHLLPTIGQQWRQRNGQEGQSTDAR